MGVEGVDGTIRLRDLVASERVGNKLMGFMIFVTPGPISATSFTAALDLHRAWPLESKRLLAAEVASEHCRIACLTYESGYASKIWRQTSAGTSSGSFVYICGWCYRIGSSGGWPDSLECETILQRQRQGLPPLDDSYSGNFVALVYDSERQTIVVQPDHWAMSGVYYSVSPCGIAVSNRSAAVANLVSASLDGYSVMSLLRGTHMPFGRTLFSNVHRVMCGCYLEIDIRMVQLELHRAFPIYGRIEKSSTPEAAKDIEEILCGMAKRWSASANTILDLTGGNDSRVTAAATLHENRGGLAANLAWCVTGSVDHPDVRIAKKIAEHCNWPLLALDKQAVGRESIECLQHSVLQADATCLVESAAGRIKQELARGPEWWWHIGSIGGELLRGFFWRHEFFSLGRSQRVNYDALLAYRLYASRTAELNVLGEQSPSLGEHDESLLAPYRRIGEIGNDILNPYKLDAMYLHKLCYSAGSTQSWLMGLRNIKFPLLSWELTRLVLSVPWKIRATRRLQLKVINDIAPELSAIPNDNGEPMRPLRYDTWYSYLKGEILIGARTVPRVVNRYTNLLQNSKQMPIKDAPAALPVMAQAAKELVSVFDRSVVQKSLAKVASGLYDTDSIRALETVFTIDLLLRSTPNVSRKVTFKSGPHIPS